MILLAEAGATKINWVIISKNKADNFISSGYNPNVSDANLLRQILISSFPAHINTDDIIKIEYFGAGCGSLFGVERVTKALRNFFNCAKNISVYTDLLGAAKALLGKSSGVVGILGTGANAGYYNGSAIEYQAPSVGYLLGDEGSGAYMGRLFLAAILRNELGDELVNDFYKEFKINREKLVQLIYSNRQVNKYLASFVPYFKANQDAQGVKQIIQYSFSEYINNYLNPVLQRYPNSKVVMVGGVASNFSFLLKKAFSCNNIILSDVEGSPLERLQIKYIL